MGVRWRYGNYYVTVWAKKAGGAPYATGLKSKREAEAVDYEVRRALRYDDYAGLSYIAGRICIKVLQRNGEELPDELKPHARPATHDPSARVTEDSLTLWDAVNITLSSPSVRDSANYERHEIVFMNHAVRYFGKRYRICDLWVPQVEEYLAYRRSQGAAGSTVAKCKSALSVMFRELIKRRLVQSNPVSEVKAVDESDGEREVYLSPKDFHVVLRLCPAWTRSYLQTLYFTGMRGSEVISLTWDDVDLGSRIIRLRKHQTKERKPKRVPIHKQLVGTLICAREGKSRGDLVFRSPRKNPVRADSVRQAWNKAVDAAATGMDYQNDLRHVTVKDIRHVWITNAMRSGMDPFIREAIVGHSMKRKDVSVRYLSINDQDLVKAIDSMTFDHGETKIWIARNTRIP